MKKLLIANRGEIALRVMRSAREMGIATVAVYAETDRQAPHVLFADQAVCIGGPAASDSYLSIPKILDACRKTGADAVHPGYGFLSENAEFARAVEAAGLLFVGPPVAAIEMMGDKLKAKAAAKKQAVPLLPGTDEPVKAPDEAVEIAREIGFPLLIKAAAGGGGKGMRIVKDIHEFKSQLELAISESYSAFADGSVFLEKYLPAPRHIEIQVLADQQGNAVYLFERECSIQRRHQKVIEEAPSAVVDAGLRRKMGDCALALCKACDYVGAGTVEFIVDEDLRFYFLEMNTRLQVEHPVTEMITGIDLVKEQLKIARGEALSFSQDDIPLNGHSIELRVYAEDPATGFLPDSGLLHRYRPPLGPGIRVDDGYREGMEVPIHYDPLISKLVVHAENRSAAIARMLRAIEEYQIAGLYTTLDFGRFALSHQAFVSGDFDTHFIEKYFNPDQRQSEEAAITNDEEKVLSIASYILINRLLKNKKCHNVSPFEKGDQDSQWRRNRKQY